MKLQKSLRKKTTLHLLCLHISWQTTIAISDFLNSSAIFVFFQVGQIIWMFIYLYLCNNVVIMAKFKIHKCRHLKVTPACQFSYTVLFYICLLFVLHLFICCIYFVVWSWKKKKSSRVVKLHAPWSSRRPANFRLFFSLWEEYYTNESRFDSVSQSLVFKSPSLYSLCSTSAPQLQFHFYLLVWMTEKLIWGNIRYLQHISGF